MHLYPTKYFQELQTLPIYCWSCFYRQNLCTKIETFSSRFLFYIFSFMRKASLQHFLPSQNMVIFASIVKLKHFLIFVVIHLKDQTISDACIFCNICHCPYNTARLVDGKSSQLNASEAVGIFALYLLWNAIKLF